CCGNNFMSTTDKVTGKTIRGQILWVHEEYFKTSGVPLLMGRGLTAGDTEGTQPVVVVNEAFVREHFPDTGALGKTANGEVVGVVADAPLNRLRQGQGPAMYWAYRQGGAYGRLTFRIRTNVDPMSVFPAIRDSLHQIEPRLPIFNIRTMTLQVTQNL